MGRKERQLTINENLKNLDTTYHYKEGIIKFRPEPAEKINHFMAKCLTAWELKNNNVDFYTEAIFANGSRADIYVPLWNSAIEIVSSESKESMINKEDKYPCKVSFLKADDVLKQNGIEIK